MTTTEAAGLSPSSAPWYMGTLNDTLFGVSMLVALGAVVALGVVLFARRGVPRA